MAITDRIRVMAVTSVIPLTTENGQISNHSHVHTWKTHTLRTSCDISNLSHSNNAVSIETASNLKQNVLYVYLFCQKNKCN